MNNKKKIPNMSDFIDITQADSESLRLKANLLLNHYKIDQSGILVEDFVKNLFNKMFHPRFKATSGYIVYTKSKENTYKFSPHIDLLIVDNMVPNVLFPQIEFEDKTEFVPKEAVVGIFEIKKDVRRRLIQRST